MPEKMQTDSCSPAVQAIGWLGGLAVAVAGLFGFLADLNSDVILIYVVLLILAPLFWLVRFVPRSRISRRLIGTLFNWISGDNDSTAEPVRKASPVVWFLTVIVGLTSLGMSVWISQKFGDLPPAYHDEYSYLFQAKTFAAGKLWYPSHPTAPRLFDQMHVLNEGHFASRFFPATGAWLTPFVAIGKPYWGQWLAGAMAAMLLFWTGRDLAGTGVGFLAGMILAMSPGVGLFSNLLLAHHPTMLGLMLFLFSFLRMKRTGCCGYALLAGLGLSFAMLARPMTAAGFGLPFGIWFFYRLWQREPLVDDDNKRSRLKLAVCLGTPILAGLVLLFFYNRAITGSGLTTPYQLFTDIYTPRHVYGFHNVIRGEQRLGPRVIENYDRWAENLTLTLSAKNSFIRLIQSWKWTLGVVPLLIITLTFPLCRKKKNGEWRMVFAAIVSLFAVHVPYWFVGIMGWHYVFESAPLWALVFAKTTQTLFASWSSSSRLMMPFWWATLTAIAILSNLADFALFEPAKLDIAVSEVAFSREKYARFRLEIASVVGSKKALVLVEPDPSDRHIDYILNDPDLQGQVLLGRLRPDDGKSEIEKLVRQFPDRVCYLFRVQQHQWERLTPER